MRPKTMVTIACDRLLSTVKSRRSVSGSARVPSVHVKCPVFRAHHPFVPCRAWLPSLQNLCEAGGWTGGRRFIVLQVYCNDQGATYGFFRWNKACLLAEVQSALCIAPGVGWCLPPSTERIIKLLPDTVLYVYVCFVRPLSFFLSGGGRPRSVSIDFTNDAPRRAILPAAVCCSWAQAYWWLRW